MAVGTAISAGMPGERFGTKRPKPSTRDVCGTIQNAARLSGDKLELIGQTTSRTSVAKTTVNQPSCAKKIAAGTMAPS